MTIGWGSRLAIGLAGAAAISVPSEIAVAQEFGSGFEITGSVRARVEIDDNGSLDDPSPGTDTTFGTDFAIDIRSSGDVSELELSFGATLQQEDRAGRPNDNGFVDQFVNLDYMLEGPSNRLELSGRYQRRDLEDLFIDGDFEDEDLVVDGGTLDITSLDGTIEFGTSAPLGARLAYSLSDRNYRDTASTTLTDNRSQNIRLSAVARPSQVLTFDVFVELDEFEDDDAFQTERTTRRAGVGIDYQVSPVLNVAGEVFANDVEETLVILGMPVETENDGFGLDFLLTREVPDGAYTLKLEREVTTFTTRDELRAGRAFEFPDGSLSFDLGISDTDLSDPELVGALYYERETPRGLLTARLERQSLVNNDNEIRVREFGRLGYRHDITPIDAMDFRVEYARSRIVGPLSDDSSTSTLIEITYSRQVNKDWDWRIGYRGRYRDDSPGISATSNALITSFGRSFSIRP